MRDFCGVNPNALKLRVVYAASCQSKTHLVNLVYVLKVCIESMNDKFEHYPNDALPSMLDELNVSLHKK